MIRAMAAMVGVILLATWILADGGVCQNTVTGECIYMFTSQEECFAYGYQRNGETRRYWDTWGWGSGCYPYPTPTPTPTVPYLHCWVPGGQQWSHPSWAPGCYIGTPPYWCEELIGGRPADEWLVTWTSKQNDSIHFERYKTEALARTRADDLISDAYNIEVDPPHPECIPTPPPPPPTPPVKACFNPFTFRCYDILPQLGMSCGEQEWRIYGTCSQFCAVYPELCGLTGGLINPTPAPRVPRKVLKH